MALLADFVAEIASAPGTSTTINLAGVVTPGPFKTFASAFTTGAKVYYTISDESSQRETGVGTFTAGSPNTLSRDTVTATTTAASTARLNFIGTVYVYCSLPASKALFIDENGAVPALSLVTLNANSAAITTAATIGTTLAVAGASNLHATNIIGSATISDRISLGGSASFFLGPAVTTAYPSLAFAANQFIQYYASTDFIYNCTTGFHHFQGTRNLAIGAYGFLTSTTGGFNGSGSTFPVGILSDFDVVALRFEAVSDERLKTDVEEMTPERGVEFVLRSTPVTFTMDGQHSAGFIAQDQVRAGFHEMVRAAPHPGMPEHVADDGFVSPAEAKLTMDYDQAIPYLTAALKNALQRIEVLESKVPTI